MKYVDDLTCVCVRIRSSKYLPTFSYSSFIEFMLTIGGSFSLLIAPFFFLFAKEEAEEEEEVPSHTPMPIHPHTLSETRQDT